MAKKVNPKPAAKAAPTAAPKKPQPTRQSAQEVAKPSVKLTPVQWLCILLAVFSVALYYNTLPGTYVLDDVMVIKENRIVRKGISAIPELLSTPHLLGYLKLGNDTYRPLSLVLYAAVFEFAGDRANAANDNTSAFHLCNILVFAGCVVLLFLFLDKLFYRKRTLLAFMASLIFASHPLHTEVVANIKSMDELLCFFFAFLSLNFYADYMKTGKWAQLALGFSSLFLSYISKETVIAFLFVVPFIFYFYLDDDKRRSLYVSVTSTLAGVLFLALRWAILTQYKANVHSNINFVDNFLVRSPTAVSRLATEVLILGKYLWLHVIPNPLISDYSFRSIEYVNFGDIWVLVSLVVYVALIGLAVYRLVKIKKDPVVFGIVFYLATLALFSNIPVTIGSALAERFTFYCTVGICVLLAFVIEHFVARTYELTALRDGKVLMSLVPLVAIYALVTYNRNQDWLSDYSLYQADLQKSPNNIRLAYDLSNEMEKAYEKEADPVKKKQMIQKSMEQLRHALAIHPYYSDAHFELGVDFFNMQMMDSAEWQFKKAIELNPRQSNAMFNLATVYMRQNRYAESQIYYHKTIDVNPDRFPAIFNEGVCYYYIQKWDSAIYDFKKTIDLAPGYYDYKSFNYTAIIYKSMGRMDSAVRYEALAQKHDPKFKL